MVDNFSQRRSWTKNLSVKIKPWSCWNCTIIFVTGIVSSNNCPAGIRCFLTKALGDAQQPPQLVKGAQDKSSADGYCRRHHSNRNYGNHSIITRCKDLAYAMLKLVKMPHHSYASHHFGAEKKSLPLTTFDLSVLKIIQCFIPHGSIIDKRGGGISLKLDFGCTWWKIEHIP